ncbi:MAG TPA: lactonase family protein [Gemmatimonadales bacterium]|jgi:6-phosphogluconolactonase|nr:lactonase family protein [Gemmatimonadales bacterium]
MTDPRDPSRRDFLAASAIGLIGLTGGSMSSPDGDLLYVGTYTESTQSEGLYLVRMDRRSGQLRRVGSVAAGANPSFLALHPHGRVLYSVNELEKYQDKPTGAVSAFAIAWDTGALTRLNEQPSEGGAPCFVSVDRGGQVALVANYAGGSVALLPIEANGALAPAASVVQHTGKGPNAERQEAPHAHCILSDPSNRFALAADLGADRVFVYRLDVGGKSLRHVEGGDAVMRPGSGPRHIAFHPTLPLVFVANELDSTVATLRFDAERGVLSPQGTRSTLPAGWTGTNYPADIHVAASGRALYVSNRGHDSIAVFSVAESTGALALDQVVPTEGNWPRNFSLHPTGRWLLVANQRSDSVVVFGCDPQNGRLTPTRQRIAIPSPVCVRFLAPPRPH